MKKGITLVELLIYLALVSGMLVSFIYYTIGVTSSTESLNISNSNVESARTALNLISSKIRTAINVIEPLPTQTSARLRLQLTSTTTLAFELVGGVIVATDQASNSWPVTDSNALISNLNFRRRDSGGSANIDVSFSVGQDNWRTSVTQKITP